MVLLGRHLSARLVPVQTHQTAPTMLVRPCNEGPAAWRTVRGGHGRTAGPEVAGQSVHAGKGFGRARPGHHWGDDDRCRTLCEAAARVPEICFALRWSPTGSPPVHGRCYRATMRLPSPARGSIVVAYPTPSELRDRPGPVGRRWSDRCALGMAWGRTQPSWTRPRGGRRPRPGSSARPAASRPARAMTMRRQLSPAGVRPCRGYGQCRSAAGWCRGCRWAGSTSPSGGFASHRSGSLVG